MAIDPLHKCAKFEDNAKIICQPMSDCKINDVQICIRWLVGWFPKVVTKHYECEMNYRLWIKIRKIFNKTQ